MMMMAKTTTVIRHMSQGTLLSLVLLIMMMRKKELLFLLNGHEEVLIVSKPIKKHNREHTSATKSAAYALAGRVPNTKIPRENETIASRKTKKVHSR